MPATPAEASDSPRPSVWREHRKMILFFGGFLLLLALFGLWRWALSVRVEAALSEIRARGEPVTMAELLAKLPPMPPLSENAAEYYRRAGDVIHRPSDEQFKVLPLAGEAKLPEGSEPMSPQILSAIEAFLSENSAAIDLLQQGARLKECRFISGPSSYVGHSIVLPLSGLRRAVELLCLHAVVHAERGESSDAIGSLSDAWGISDAIAEEPATIDHAVRCVLRGEVSGALSRVMCRCTLSDAMLADLMQTLDSGKIEYALAQAFVGERVTGIDYFEKGPMEMIEDFHTISSPAPWQTQLAVSSYTIGGLWQLDELKYIQSLNDLIVAAHGPTSKRITLIDGNSEAQTTRWLPIDTVAKIIGVSVTKSIAEAPGEALQDVRTIAKVRTAILAMAVERHRLAHGGALPTDLNQLVPAFIERIPEDPFTGKPLIFKALPKGFTVYSVGEDLHDDGGARTNPAGKEFEPGTDIPFTFAR